MSGRRPFARRRIVRVRVGAESRETELCVLRDNRIGDEHGQSMAAGGRSAARAFLGEPAPVPRTSSAPTSPAMFPILNAAPSRSPPLITWALIAANSLA